MKSETSQSTTSGVTFTWAESIAYRDFRVQLRYGKYRLMCGGFLMNDYTEMVRYGTGGFASTTIGVLNFSQNTGR